MLLSSENSSSCSKIAATVIAMQARVIMMGYSDELSVGSAQCGDVSQVAMGRSRFVL